MIRRIETAARVNQRPVSFWDARRLPVCPNSKTSQRGCEGALTMGLEYRRSAESVQPRNSSCLTLGEHSRPRNSLEKQKSMNFAGVYVQLLERRGQGGLVCEVSK